MNLAVEYIDQAQSTFSRTYNLTRLAFAKHFAIAGQGYAPSPQKLIRTVAMFFHYSNYMRRREFNNNRFSEPPIQLSDPTEKAHFSNLAGRAIADFLSKQIDKSLFTVNYEAAMRLRNMPIKGKRPDLLAFKANGMFAIEAKGYSGGYGDMAEHKSQSQTGGIAVNYTIASVSYNMFNRVKCKYHDPYNDNVQFDNELLRRLTQRYYQGLLQFLNQEYFSFRQVTIQGEEFYEIELYYSRFERLFYDQFPFRYFGYFAPFERYWPRLILPIRIREYAEKGITNEVKPFLMETSQQDVYTYIDNDRVGLRVTR